MTNPDTLQSRMPIDASLFSLFVHENYITHAGDIDQCATAMEWMSLSDLSLAHGWDWTECERAGVSMCVRGMACLHGVAASFRPLVRAKVQGSPCDFFAQQPLICVCRREILRRFGQAPSGLHESCLKRHKLGTRLRICVLSCSMKYFLLWDECCLLGWVRDLAL